MINNVLITEVLCVVSGNDPSPVWSHLESELQAQSNLFPWHLGELKGGCPVCRHGNWFQRYWWGHQHVHDTWGCLQQLCPQSPRPPGRRSQRWEWMSDGRTEHNCNLLRHQIRWPFLWHFKRSQKLNKDILVNVLTFANEAVSGVA